MQKKQQIQLYLFTIKKHEMLEKIHTQTSRENICGFFIENMQNIGCFTQTNIKYVFFNKSCNSFTNMFHPIFFNAIFIHVAFDHKQIPYMVGGTRILIFINLT